jgi:hypothetical protein
MNVNSIEREADNYRGEAQRLFQELPGPQKIPLVIRALTILGLVFDDSILVRYGMDPSMYRRPGWYSQYREFIKPGNDTLSNFNELIKSIAEDYSSSAKDYSSRADQKRIFYMLLSKTMKNVVFTTQHPNTVSSSAYATAIPSANAAPSAPLTAVSSSASAVPPPKKPACDTGSCSISGGAGRRRRRGTKRARRIRRRSSRKN